MAGVTNVVGAAGAPAGAPVSAPVIIVEGEIGAGKTELVKAIAGALSARGLNTCTILEPVDKWKEIGILQLFYGDPRRYAYSFQTYVYATRIMAIAAAIAANPSADVYILERSPATDLIFMELQRDLAEPAELQMYKTWCEAWRLMLPIDLARARILYLKTSLGCCMARVAARCREGEVPAGAPDNKPAAGVSLEYQARLRRAHEAFFQRLHTNEFPLMPQSPFPPSAIIELGPELADGNFRDGGAERDRIIAAVLKKAGF
jgi:deoxyadenosine/deoxycytidine kinase